MTICRGSNFDAEDFDDYNVLQRDLKVDGGLRPVTEEQVLAVRRKAAKAMQAIFAALNFPPVTDEEVEQNVLADGSKDVTAQRDVNEDLKAAKRILDGEVSGVDIVRALADAGFTGRCRGRPQHAQAACFGDICTRRPSGQGLQRFFSINARTPIKAPAPATACRGRWKRLKISAGIQLARH